MDQSYNFLIDWLIDRDTTKFPREIKNGNFPCKYLRIPFNLNTNKLETATERLLTACSDCCLLSVSVSRGFIIQSRGEDGIGKQSEGNFPQKSISRIQTNIIYISICKYNIKLLQRISSCKAYACQRNKSCGGLLLIVIMLIVQHVHIKMSLINCTADVVLFLT